MTQKRLIVSYQNLSQDVVEALNKKYPDGFENHVMKVDKGNGSFFYAVTVDYNDISYLVKVNVLIDSNIDAFDDDVDDSEDEKNDLVTGLKDEPSTEDEDVIG